MQGGRVTRQQLVGHIVGLVLQVENLALVGQAQRDHHLTLPHRNRGGDGGVDLVHDGLVRVLDDFDLRRGLQGNHADAVEVLGKTVELGLEVLQHLRLHGVATGGGLGLQRWQLVGVEVGERLLAGQYGHFQLAVLLGVLRVHRVVHGDVGHEFGLRGLEGGDEVLHGIVVGQFGYGRDLVERAGHAESADRIGAGEVGRAEAMALPRQLLHRRCFQQVQQCAAFSRPRPSACGCSTRSASGRR